MAYDSRTGKRVALTAERWAWLKEQDQSFCSILRDALDIAYPINKMTAKGGKRQKKTAKK